MQNIRPARLLMISVILLIVATGLMVATHITSIPVPAGPAEFIPVRPSPAWDSLPTRIPAPTPTSAVTAPLHDIQSALMRGDFDTAEAVWKTAEKLTGGQSIERGLVMREGARVALARGAYEDAETRIWEAIRIRGKDAEAWSLLGTILARRDEPRAAEQALAIAETLDPSLASDLFTARWVAARRAGNSDIMMALAQVYSSQHPDAPLAFYYRSAALLATGDAESTIDQLVAILGDAPEAPAILWYTLGEAYLARQAYTQTLTVLDVAGSLFGQGDNSLYLASDDPVRDLNLRRAQAYLGINTPARCADAEPLLQRWNAPADVISRSIACQTPTPTMTPWIPSQQDTPTPTP